MRRPRGKIFFGVEPETHPVHHPAAAPGALVRRRLRNALHPQLLDLLPRRIALDPRQPRIDHIADARHGERSLGHVGSQDHPRQGSAPEDARLLLRRLAREERQDLELAAHRRPPLQRLLGFPNFTLAGQEDEDVPRPLAPGFLDAGDDPVEEIALLGGGARRALSIPFLPFERGEFLPVDRLHRTVTDLDRIEPPAHLEDGNIARHRREMRRKALGIHRRRGDHHLEILAAREQAMQIAEQEVDVEAALMRLVDDDGIVARQPRIACRLGQQNAIRHQGDVRLGRGAVVETHLVAHVPPQRRAQFLGDALGRGPRGDAPRLGMGDLPGDAAPGGEADLGQLRRLARTGLPADDHHPVRADRRLQLGGALAHRQIGHALGPGTTRQARLPRRLRALQALRELRREPLARLALGPAQALDERKDRPAVL